jgi:hypothetical protein
MVPQASAIATPTKDAWKAMIFHRMFIVVVVLPAG